MIGDQEIWGTDIVFIFAEPKPNSGEGYRLTKVSVVPTLLKTVKSRIRKGSLHELEASHGEYVSNLATNRFCYVTSSTNTETVKAYSLRTDRSLVVRNVSRDDLGFQEATQSPWASIAGSDDVFGGSVVGPKMEASYSSTIVTYEVKSKGSLEYCGHVVVPCDRVVFSCVEGSPASSSSSTAAVGGGSVRYCTIMGMGRMAIIHNNNNQQGLNNLFCDFLLTTRRRIISRCLSKAEILVIERSGKLIRYKEDSIGSGIPMKEWEDNGDDRKHDWEGFTKSPCANILKSNSSVIDRPSKIPRLTCGSGCIEVDVFQQVDASR